jgi:Cellulase (glycosyl hydrolase family 5)
VSAVQTGVVSTQSATAGTVQLLVADPSAVASAAFRVIGPDGAATGPLPPDRTPAPGVFEKDVPRDRGGPVRVEPVLTLADGSTVAAEPAVFDALPPDPEAPRVERLELAPEWGRLTVTALVRGGAGWRCWVRRDGWPTADGTPQGAPLDAYLRFDGPRDRTGFSLQLDGPPGTPWYAVAAAYGADGWAGGPRATASAPAAYDAGGTPGLEVRVERTDSVERRKAIALEALDGFVQWLRRYGQRGFVSEVGWPQDDAAAWNEVARAWFQKANEAGLWVTAWATGEDWNKWDYRLQPYRLVNGAWTAMPQSAVLEENPTPAGANPPYLRGVNVAGAEFGAPTVESRAGWFSNEMPGTYGVDWVHNGAATYQYLAGRGQVLARIPFRWERIQPALGQPLDPVELGRLQAGVAAAGAAGMRVVLDVHNYGAYYLHDPATGEGVRRSIGSAQVTAAHFADLWRRLALAFEAEPAVILYGLMNEPVEMEGEAAAWAAAAQAAADAIRSTGSTRWIGVGGYNWSHTWAPEAEHGGPFVNDPLDRVMYEAHTYWDQDRSGRYATRELAAVTAEHWVRWQANEAMWAAEDGIAGDGVFVRVFREGEEIPFATVPLWAGGAADGPLHPCQPGSTPGCAWRTHAYRVTATDRLEGTRHEYAASIGGYHSTT